MKQIEKMNWNRLYMQASRVNINGDSGYNGSKEDGFSKSLQNFKNGTWDLLQNHIDKIQDDSARELARQIYPKSFLALDNFQQEKELAGCIPDELFNEIRQTFSEYVQLSGEAYGAWAAERRLIYNRYVDYYNGLDDPIKATIQLKKLKQAINDHPSDRMRDFHRSVIDTIIKKAIDQLYPDSLDSFEQLPAAEQRQLTGAIPSKQDEKKKIDKAYLDDIKEETETLLKDDNNDYINGSGNFTSELYHAVRRKLKSEVEITFEGAHNVVDKPSEKTVKRRINIYFRVKYNSEIEKLDKDRQWVNLI